ncbi:hypothetical protein BDF22DRAFT_667942 [Syncephalis plumigaleata]|nr:hypothetical protein BDF22DRAFT_667942 [Syncephalis plumigaleata]
MKLSTASILSLVVASLIGSIMAGTIPAPKSDIVQPQDMKIVCWFKSIGCPACPDGYHQVKREGSTKYCMPDEGAPFYMVPCPFFGSKCMECPAGWEWDGRRYATSTDTSGYLYCRRK